MSAWIDAFLPFLLYKPNHVSSQAGRYQPLLGILWQRISDVFNISGNLSVMITSKLQFSAHWPNQIFYSTFGTLRDGRSVKLGWSRRKEHPRITAWRKALGILKCLPSRYKSILNGPPLWKKPSDRKCRRQEAVSVRVFYQLIWVLCGGWETDNHP